MKNGIVVPKIKKDMGGTPIEKSLEPVHFEELLRSPDDVRKTNELMKDYDDGGLKIKVNAKRQNRRF